jgi:DNA-damage-inducible protein J
MSKEFQGCITIFAKKVSRERRIPFEVSADPFYSENNMKHLEQVIADIAAGRAKLVEHDLTEVD